MADPRPMRSRMASSTWRVVPPRAADTTTSRSSATRSTFDATLASSTRPATARTSSTLRHRSNHFVIQLGRPLVGRR
jgi:hypothetical protein